MSGKKAATATELPQVKQCNTIGDWQLGATATAAGPNRWLVANPTNGGHWATDDDVKDWIELPLQTAVEAPVAEEDSK